MRRRDILPALLLFLAGTTCSKAGTYTYVDVYVSIDRQTVPTSELAKVTSCEFQVLGAEMSDATNLPCIENRVPYELGTFQWTSGATSGTLQFRVRIFDGNLVVLGEATSAPVAVSPGKHLQTSVLVLGVEPTTGTDGGSGDASSTADAGIEVGSDGPAPTDGIAADGGSDQSAPGDAGARDTATDVGADGGGTDSGPDASASDVATSDAAGTDVVTDAVDAAKDVPADVASVSDATPDAPDGPTGDGSPDVGDAASGG